MEPVAPGIRTFLDVPMIREKSTDRARETTTVNTYLGGRIERSAMSDYELDDVERQLVTLLQENARYTAVEMAERIGVSDNTVHKRMSRLEEAGVITGYHANVDHDRTGLALHFIFICTARISKRSAVADQAMQIPEVVEVTELMTGQRNLHIKLLGAEDEDITRLAERIDQLELEINDENLLRGEHTKPMDYTVVDLPSDVAE